MGHFEDATELITYARHTLPRIKQAYDQSLRGQTVEPGLRIKIKNLLENLRSALDYSAHGLFDAYGASATSDPRIYFPYATLSTTRTQFLSVNRIENCIPGITASRPDIVARIEAYQHYSDSSNRWLPLLMALTNENKHQNLTPQTRHEKRGLEVRSRGAAIKLGPGASIGLGTGASVSIGDAHIPGGQRISGKSPARFSGSGQQTVTVWASFTFDNNGEEVLSFLETAVDKTDAIVAELASL